MGELRVRALKRPVNLRPSIPGDEGIAHRALVMAALADGRSRIQGFAPTEHLMGTVRAMQAVGAFVERIKPDMLLVNGCRGICRQVLETVDCDGSGTLLRLMCGVLAGQPFPSRVSGSAGLQGLSMRGPIGALTQMGALIEGERRDFRPPLRIGGSRLQGTDLTGTDPTGHVKASVLMAGMFAEGTTSFTEPALSRDHTERIMRAFGVPLRTDMHEDGATTSLVGGTFPQGRDMRVPGDFSTAAVWMALAASRQGGTATFESVGLNPSRTGFESVLMRMGAHVAEFVESEEDSEPLGRVTVTGQGLTGTEVQGREVVSVIGEIALVAVLGALAIGETIIRDAGALRSGRLDRLGLLATNLRTVGAVVEETEDGLIIQGGHPLRGAALSCGGDARLAMAFAVLGLHCEGETRIVDAECVRWNYPAFERQLARLR